MRGTRMIQADIIAKRRMKDRLDSSPDWYRCFVPDVGFVMDHELVERELHVLRRTPKRCSCWQCGNPRRYRGELTRQERDASDVNSWDDDLRQEAEDYPDLFCPWEFDEQRDHHE